MYILCVYILCVHINPYLYHSVSRSTIYPQSSLLNNCHGRLSHAQPLYWKIWAEGDMTWHMRHMPCHDTPGTLTWSCHTMPWDLTRTVAPPLWIWVSCHRSPPKIFSDRVKEHVSEHQKCMIKDAKGSKGIMSHERVQKLTRTIKIPINECLDKLKKNDYATYATKHPVSCRGAS